MSSDVLWQKRKRFTAPETAKTSLRQYVTWTFLTLFISTLTSSPQYKWLWTHTFTTKMVVYRYHSQQWHWTVPYHPQPPACSHSGTNIYWHRVQGEAFLQWRKKGWTNLFPITIDSDSSVELLLMFIIHQASLLRFTYVEHLQVHQLKVGRICGSFSLLLPDSQPLTAVVCVRACVWERVCFVVYIVIRSKTSYVYLCILTFSRRSVQDNVKVYACRNRSLWILNCNYNWSIVSLTVWYESSHRVTFVVELNVHVFALYR